MSDAKRCPVCEGRGDMPAGFYSGTADGGRETCRTCGGTGMVVTEASHGTASEPTLDLTYRG